jgi:hypothetical protein
VSYQATATGQTNKMTLSLVFFADSSNHISLPAGDYTIVGQDQNASGLTFHGTLTANGLTLTGTVQSDQSVPSTIFDGTMQIDWSVTRAVSGASPDTETAPASSNHLYVTGAAAPGAFETVLDVGCRSANGDDPSGQVNVLNDIWQKTFATRSFAGADRATPLEYLHPTGITTASLVADKQGQCGAWGHFFVDVLAAQGVTAHATLIKAPASPKAFEATWARGLVIEDSWAQGSPDQIYHVPWQPPHPVNGLAASWYADHVVVETSVLPGFVLDPSFGNIYASRKQWEASVLAAFVYDPGPTLLGTPPDVITESGPTLLAIWGPYP